MIRKLLVVVDFQKDFYHPDGALYVEGAEKKQGNVKKLIKKVNKTCFTVDFHPVNHCSFKEQGGIWPSHCVNYTEGSGIPNELVLESLNNIEEPYFLLKGRNPLKEEYGAFDINSVFDSHSYDWMHENYDEVIVCGIAAEYCVLETLKNLVKNFGDKKGKLKVYLDGVAKFDKNGTTLEDYMKENKIEEYKL